MHSPSLRSVVSSPPWGCRGHRNHLELSAWESYASPHLLNHLFMLVWTHGYLF